MTEVACAVRDVTKSFGSRTVLDQVCVDVTCGQMLAMQGASGSGKSTLLNIIGLLDRADSGQVELFGAPAPRPGRRAAMMLRRHRIGYLFQNYALIDNASVDANLRVAQQPQDVRSGARARAEALSRVGLEGDPGQRVYELSGGEQQRLSIARLLVAHRDLVLADEPTGSLDPANRDLVLDLLRDIADSGTAVLIVTHDEAVAARCDRVVDLPAPGAQLARAAALAAGPAAARTRSTTRSS